MSEAATNYWMAGHVMAGLEMDNAKTELITLPYPYPGQPYHLSRCDRQQTNMVLGSLKQDFKILRSKSSSNPWFVGSIPRRIANLPCVLKVSEPGKVDS